MSRAGLPFKGSGLALVLVSPLLVGLPQPQESVALPGHEPTRLASPSQNRDLQSLPLPAQASISAVLGRDSASYHAIRQGNGLHADNPNHGLAADFTARGVELHAGTARFGLALRGYGYGEALSPVSDVAPEAIANRVEYRRGALTEWYVNGPLGLEQGFTLEALPGPRPRGELLTLALDLSGDVQPTLDASGAGLTLHQADGRPALRYGGLSAYDTDGRALPVWLEMQGEGLLRLHVDDDGARYPLVIDPMVQAEPGKAKLTAPASGDLFGWSVAIDGDKVVVGDFMAAYVFVEPVGGWFGRLTETAKLTASDGVAGDNFGYSVAISGDTVVVGAWDDDIGGNSGQGSAYVYVEPGGGWGGILNETAKLTASDGAAFEEFGRSVAISGDTVVVGAPGDDIHGSAYVFVEPGGGWGGNLTETAKLTASDGNGGRFGYSVAIDGDTLVAGAWGDIVGGNQDQGSAYVFVEPAGGWGGSLTEAAKLTVSDGHTFAYFGWSVAIGGDTVVAGAPLAHVGGNYQQGSAYVFVEPAGGWGGDLTETAKLTASRGAVEDNFGYSVGISGDLVVVGADLDDIGGNSAQGSALVFVEPAGGWGGNLTETAKLRARDGAAVDLFGHSVAIDGDTIVAGAPFDDIGGNVDQGSAYVFVLGP